MLIIIVIAIIVIFIILDRKIGEDRVDNFFRPIGSFFSIIFSIAIPLTVIGSLILGGNWLIKNKPEIIPVYNNIVFQHKYSDDYFDEYNKLKLTINYDKNTKSFVATLMSPELNIELFSELIFIKEKDFFYKTLDEDLFLMLDGKTGDKLTIIEGEDKLIFYKQ